MMDCQLQIISVWFNRSQYLDVSIDSVVSQLGESMTLTIVNDGSTDDTIQMLKKYEKYERVNIINKVNTGFVDSIITGIESSNSKYIAIHGSADISRDGRFKAQLEYLETHKSVITGCLFEEVIGDVVKVYGQAYDDIDYSKKILNKNPYSHGEVMFLRSAYEKAGGYRRFFKFAQDRDLWCRLSTIGTFGSVNKILYKKNSNVKGTVSQNPNKIIQQKYYSCLAIDMHKNRYKIYKENSFNFSDEMFGFLLLNRNGLRFQILKQLLRSIKRKEKDKANIYLSALELECGRISILFIKAILKVALK